MCALLMGKAEVIVFFYEYPSTLKRGKIVTSTVESKNFHFKQSRSVLRIFD